MSRVGKGVLGVVGKRSDGGSLKAEVDRGSRDSDAEVARRSRARVRVVG